MPAVIWVLAFTVFPLGYSLYIAFYKIEQKVEITREKVPMLDEDGEPVLSKSGKPRTRNIVHKNEVSTSEFVGGFNFKRLINDPQVWSAVKVTAIFVGVAVPLQLGLGLPARPFVQSASVRKTCSSRRDDPPDLRDADCGRLSVLHDLL